MNPFRFSLPAFVCFFLLGGAQPARAQFLQRTYFKFDTDSRALVQTNYGVWTRFINGMPERTYVENGRTANFVEIYTENPGPTWVRIYSNQILWRAQGDTSWRVGGTGGWVR
jgi:hypothetical protein